MKKYTLANVIAFIIGIYFIIRGCLWFFSKDGDVKRNKFFGVVYFSIGIIAFIIQFVVNYLKKKKNNRF